MLNIFAGCVNSGYKMMAHTFHISMALLVGLVVHGVAADVKTETEKKVCAEGLLCEGECCTGFSMVMPYCCSKNEGYIYLGLMIGTAVLTGIGIFACYRIMLRSERELQAAARLEEAKAANRIINNLSWTSSDSSTSGSQDGGVQQVSSNQAPPAYNEVVGNLARCHSCDLQTDRTLGAHVCFENGSGSLCSSAIFAQQCSEGALRLDEHYRNQNFLHLVQGQSTVGLPSLVDINQMLVQHKLENFTPASPEFQNTSPQGDHPYPWPTQPGVYQMLPPPLSEEEQWNKLPTYEEYCHSPSQLSHSLEETVKRQSHLLEQCAQLTSQTGAGPDIYGSETSSLRRPMEVGRTTASSESSFTSADEDKVCEYSRESRSNGEPVNQESVDVSVDSEPKEDQDRVRHALVKLPSIQESDEEDELAQCDEGIENDDFNSENACRDNFASSKTSHNNGNSDLENVELSTGNSISNITDHYSVETFAKNVCQTNDNSDSEKPCDDTENLASENVCHNTSNSTSENVCRNSDDECEKSINSESQNRENTRSSYHEDDKANSQDHANPVVNKLDQDTEGKNGSSQSEAMSNGVYQDNIYDTNIKQAANLTIQGVICFDEFEQVQHGVDTPNQDRDPEENGLESPKDHNAKN